MQNLKDAQAFVLCDTRAPGVEWLPVWSEVGIRGRVPLKALLFPNCTDEVAEAIKSACREGAEVVDLREDPSALMDSFNALNNAKILTDLALDKALGIDTEGKTFTDQRNAYLTAIADLKKRIPVEIHQGQIASIAKSLGCSTNSLDDIFDTIAALKQNDIRERLAKALVSPVETSSVGLIARARHAFEISWAVIDELGCLSDAPTVRKRIQALKQGAVFARDYENLRADNERLRQEVAELSANKARDGILSLADALKQTTAAYNKGCADTIKAVTRLVDGGKDA